MIRFEDLLDKVRGYSPDADLELLRKAYVFSALEHKGQIRHSGEPYLVHPLEVADILADMKLDAVCIAAGLLHDVVEDTLTTPEKIREKFGEDVAHIVEGVTKIGAIPFSSSEERQAENFRKMLLAMVDDIRVILVKLADRLHNMRTLQHMADDKRVRIAQETLDIYAPIANRLGMSRIKNELEELSFRYIEPAAYQTLKGRVEAKRRPTQGMIEQLAADIRAKLSEAQVPVISIDGRVKRLYSIWLKLKAQKIDLEQVYDFVALRIVTPSVKDCYAALGIIHQTWSPVPGTHQGLHRDAAAERLPVAAHVGDQRQRLPVRSADPHRGDAPARGGRHRRALEIQGRPRRRPARRAVLPVAAAAARVAAGSARSAGVPVEPEDRSLSRRGLHVHAARHGEGAAEGLDGDRLRLRDSHRRRPPVRRRARQRPHGAAAHPPQERRHRRDRPQRDAQAEPRLAELRGHVARPQQDQAPDPGRGEGARRRARQARVRQGSAAVRLERHEAARRRHREGAGRIRGRQAGGSARADRLRQGVAAAAARQDRPAGSAEGAGAGASGRVGREARAAPGLQNPIASRCAAPTT